MHFCPVLCKTYSALKQCRGRAELLCLLYGTNAIAFIYCAYAAILVVGKFCNADTSVEKTSAGELVCMVEEVRVSLKICNSGMICKAGTFLH